MAIIGIINEVMRQAAGSKGLHKGLVFLSEVLNNKRPDLITRATSLKAGENFEVPIDGNSVFANFQAYPTRMRKDGFFEAHREFTDIQCVLEGEEWIETCPLSDHGTAPVYDAKGNFFFPLPENPGSRFLMKPGTVAVLFPQDAHAPCLRTGEQPGLIRKVVIKVKDASLPAKAS